MVEHLQRPLIQLGDGQQKQQRTINDKRRSRRARRNGCKVRSKDKEVVSRLKARIPFKVESSSICCMERPKKEQQHYPVVVTVLRRSVHLANSVTTRQ